MVVSFSCEMQGPIIVQPINRVVPRSDLVVAAFGRFPSVRSSNAGRAVNTEKRR
jgi:hypothetical protein